MVLLNTICACGYIAGPLVFGKIFKTLGVQHDAGIFRKTLSGPKDQACSGRHHNYFLDSLSAFKHYGRWDLNGAVTGLSYEVCLFLAWLCFTGFTFYSGSKGVILTQTICFSCVFVCDDAGGTLYFSGAGRNWRPCG